MARSVHTPDPALRRQVEAMAGYGIPELGIARVIGVDPKTLRKHYRSELDLGHIKANSAVAQSLFKKATGDGPQSVTAAIFWAKTRMGWKRPSSTSTAALPTTRSGSSGGSSFRLPTGKSSGQHPAPVISDPELCRDRQIEGTGWRD